VGPDPAHEAAHHPAPGAGHRHGQL
jgi:hypothetical protein